jgi:glycine hydroxymethyltransferase
MKLLNDPLPYCDIVTSTTHKTLRGPRGGLLLLGKDRENPFGLKAAKSGRVKMLSEVFDGTVMPGVQGGPLMHVIAAKAVAFGEALQPSFKAYAVQIIKNAKTLAQKLSSHGYNLISGGTDNHLMLVDLRNKGVTGKEAESALEQSGITVNKNAVPFDDKPPLVTSGIRIGTPAITTRGMRETEMEMIGDLIHQVIQNVGSQKTYQDVRNSVRHLCEKFPLYSELLSETVQHATVV